MSIGGPFDCYPPSGLPMTDPNEARIRDLEARVDGLVRERAELKAEIERLKAEVRGLRMELHVGAPWLRHNPADLPPTRAEEQERE